MFDRTGVTYVAGAVEHENIVKILGNPSNNKPAILGIRGFLLEEDPIAAGSQYTGLVLIAFFGQPSKEQCACHNNGIPTDNRLENLRWDTLSANQKDSIKHGTHDPKRGDKQKGAKLNVSLVRRIRETVGVKSDLAWANEIGCSYSQIWKVRQRKAWGWVK